MMKTFTSGKSKIAVIGLFLTAGWLLLYVSYTKKQNVSSYSLEDTTVTVIDLSKDGETFNIPLVLGVVLIVMALALAAKYYLVNQRKSPKTDKLTGQERRVVQLIESGKSNKEIAVELSISPSTVKTHINNIFKKLDINSREELLQLC